MIGTAWPAGAGYLAAALQAAVALVLLVLARRPIRASLEGLGPRGIAGLSGASAAAAVAGGLVLPAFTRHAFEGHEADYYDLFVGTRSLGGPWDPLITYPAMRLLYWGLAAVPGATPAWMLGASLAASVVSAFATGWIAWLLFRDRAAAGLAALVAGLAAPHAFWASSAYNVMVPLALSRLGLAVAVVGAREAGGRAVTCAAAAAALVGLSVAARLETGVAFAAIAWAVWAVAGPGRLSRSLPAWSVGAAVAAGSVFAQAMPLLGGIVARQAEGDPRYYLALLAGSTRAASAYAPFHHPATWPAVAAGVLALVHAGTAGRRALAALAGVLAVTHAVLGTFNDFAARHALFGATSLAVLAGAGLPFALRMAARRAPWAAAAAGLLVAGGLAGTLAADLARAARRYYAEDAAFFADVPEAARLRRMSTAEIGAGGCYVLTEHDPIAIEVGDAGSHFNLDPLSGPQVWDRHGGCVRWLYDRDNYRWTSRDVHGRAERLMALLDWRVEGLLERPDGYVAVVYRLAARPDGIPGGGRGGRGQPGGAQPGPPHGATRGPDRPLP